MNTSKGRVSEIWEAKFNGYPIVGQVLQSQLQYVRVDYYDQIPEASWIHFVRIIRSEKVEDMGKRYKWSESSRFPFEKYLKRVYPTGIWQWEIVNE